MKTSPKNRERGAALPLTLLLIAFNLVVLVALLLYSMTEQTASRNSVNAEAARIMALNGIELAGALIAQNSTNNAYVSYQNITNVSGDRLETKIANTVTSGNQWTRVVTNPTALHSGFMVPGTDGIDLNYAPTSDTNTGYIAPRTNPTNTTWTNLHPNMFQMKWVDVYKGSTNQPTNLVGRFAFWVDDESTKINLNYSGDVGSYGSGGGRTQRQSPTVYMSRARTNPSLPAPFAQYGKLGDKGYPAIGPLGIEVSGVAGLSRIEASNIHLFRGHPLKVTTTNYVLIDTNFSPFYSILEIRRTTNAGNNVITNLSQQSQLTFTATAFSREPELNFAKGTPRFDTFDLIATNATNLANRASVLSNFIYAFTNTYTNFANKYAWPLFAANVDTFYRGPNLSTNISYQTIAGETTNYIARPLPLLNETDIAATVTVALTTNTVDGVDTVTTNQTGSLNITAELIMLASGRDGAGSVFPLVASSGYKADVTFSPPIEVAGKTVSAATTLLVPDTNRWFRFTWPTTNAVTNALYKWSNAATPWTNFFRIWTEDLDGAFAVLTNSITWQTNSTNVIWKIPTNLVVTTRIERAGVTYQQVSAGFVEDPPSDFTNDITNSLLSDGINRVIFQVTAQTRDDMGIRSDPRLGLHRIHSVGYATNGVILSNSFTNTNASVYSINKTWRRDNTNVPTGPNANDYLADEMSIDITPSRTVFAADRGLPAINNEIFYSHSGYPNSSAEIGEIPITAFKGGTHLAWSTPKLWGDGRARMSNEDYPPDWLMLDCIHSTIYSAEPKGVFTTSINYMPAEHITPGRINVNGLKSYFQRAAGTRDYPDTIMDCVINFAKTKDFRDAAGDLVGPDTGLDDKSSRQIVADQTGYGLRTNILNYIHQIAIQNGSADTPFVTPFHFTANLAGNTSISNLSSLRSSYWEAYSPGDNNTSDRRIESLVRSLQQRLTTRGWQFGVYSMGQALQVVDAGGGSYKTNVLGEAYMQAVWERAPKHDTTTGEIVNSSSGGAPPMKMLYMREIR